MKVFSVKREIAQLETDVAALKRMVAEIEIQIAVKTKGIHQLRCCEDRDRPTKQYEVIR